jgi:ParB family chromosome partitioning protein
LKTDFVFEINGTFRDRIPSLSKDERARLEENLLRDGCREPLCIWFDNDIGTYYLLDGHNRFEICERHDIGYSTTEIEGIDSFEDALDWIDKNQIGKRNLSPDDFRIISGRIYNRRKKNFGGDRKSESSPQIEDLKTSAIVASELGVSKATIERNGQRAEVYDAMKSIGDEEAAEAAKTLPQAIVAKVLVETKKSEQEETEKIWQEQRLEEKYEDHFEKSFEEFPGNYVGIGRQLVDKADAEIERQNRLRVAAELKSAKAVHVSQNTGMPEWYTPPVFIESARVVLGTIDTDPASSEIAQRTVKAETFYTVDDNGLDQKWLGNVWMNPPYTSGLIDQFIDKLKKHVVGDDVFAAIVLVNNATETKWFQSLASISSAICFPSSRIRFLDPEGNLGAPLQGQAIAYIGPDAEEFKMEFSKFGFCMETMQ